jgi:hypothetical protein
VGGEVHGKARIRYKKAMEFWDGNLLWEIPMKIGGLSILLLILDTGGFFVTMEPNESECDFLNGVFYLSSTGCNFGKMLPRYNVHLNDVNVFLSLFV